MHVQMQRRACVIEDYAAEPISLTKVVRKVN